MVNITVIGTGYVGSVTGACLSDFGNRVTCVDNNPEKIKAFVNGKIPIFEPGLDDIVSRNIRSGRLSFSTDLAVSVKKSTVVFIAVGTPPKEDGSADLCYVEAASREIASAMEHYTVVVNKSTVPVGTGKKVISWIRNELEKAKKDIDFDVISNPEFLREGTAVYDFTHPDRIVIGSESDKAKEIMKDVYRPVYLTETPFIETNLESAEMIKYASNAFLSVKIAFINEVANLCEKVGADVQDVAKAMGKDGRIGSKFLHPGPGYGGSCFPKDTRAFANIAAAYGEALSIVEATIKSNEVQKLKMVEKIENGFGGTGSLNGKTIAILGLAFKQNTDDMRESPAITICEELVKRGAKLRLWDPAAMEEARWRLGKLQNSLYFANDEYEAAKGSGAVVLLTPWNQFRNLDLLRIKNSLTLPFFFDLRNMYKRNEVERVGMKYWGVGR